MSNTYEIKQLNFRTGLIGNLQIENGEARGSTDRIMETR